MSPRMEKAVCMLAFHGNKSVSVFWRTVCFSLLLTTLNILWTRIRKVWTYLITKLPITSCRWLNSCLILPEPPWRSQWTLLSLTSIRKTFQIAVSGFMCIRSVTSRIASNKISNSEKNHLLSLRICQLLRAAIAETYLKFHTGDTKSAAIPLSL